MKEVKIGHINFFQNDIWGDCGIDRFNNLCNLFNKLSNKFTYVHEDCFSTECDIVFYSVYDRIERLQLCKGNPLFILWNDELLAPGANWDNPETGVDCEDQSTFMNPLNFYKGNNLSVSYFDDNDTNCYFPYALLFYQDIINTKSKYIKENTFDKYKFATFCASQGHTYQSYYRNNIVKYISENYKEITCCGSIMNNTDGVYLSFDTWEARDYHNNYKFNICYENTMTTGSCKYITEKISRAYIYNVVPVYRGSDYINEIFNKESFINCNGLTDEEVLERIKEVDNDYDLLNYMLQQWPFKYKSIDFELYWHERVMKFIESKL